MDGRDGDSIGLVGCDITTKRYDVLHETVTLIAEAKRGHIRQACDVNLNARR